MQGAEHRTGQAHGKVADGMKSELKNMLFLNNGYSTLCKISENLNGNEAQLEGDEPELNSNDLIIFIFVPVILYDFERTFSCFRMILNDSWRSFTLKT
jgi:hypothetical protein